MKKLAGIILALCLAQGGQATSLKVVAVNKITPLKDIRLECNNDRVRTDKKGEYIFNLKPGKYSIKGPEKRTDGWIFEGYNTMAVLQSADLNIKIDKRDLGRFKYDGQSFEVVIRYVTPFGYKADISAINVPNDWNIEFENKSLSPDTKTTATIIVPEGSESEAEAIQIVASVGKQVVAATEPIKLMRGWRVKPREVNKEAVKEMLPFAVKIQSSRKVDREGTLIDTDIDFIVESDLNPRLSGNAKLRYNHIWSPQDSVDNLELRLAYLTYITGVLNITLGRFDISPIIQPGEFFGSYVTLGQKRFDGVFMLMPIMLFGSAGVDAQGFSLPPITLMTGYFPNFFSFFPEEKNFDNGYFFSELKLPIMLFNYPLIVGLNYAFTTDYAYVTYSPLSGDPAISATYEYTYSRSYRLYGEFAIGNISSIENTTALMTGASAKNIRSFTYGFLDEIALEYQIPLFTSKDNPFTGGNLFFPAQGESQQGAWYAKLKTSYDGINFIFAITNSVGDFTFARVADTAFDPRRTFDINDLRSANEVSDIGKTLVSKSYNDIAYIITINARF